MNGDHMFTPDYDNLINYDFKIYKDGDPPFLSVSHPRRAQTMLSCSWIPRPLPHPSVETSAEL
eukprot:1755755-Pyramimonas_sp.AAC.1